MEINRSIVQGSGIGPFLYILNESDLHPLSQNNEIFKYADDTNLLVPQHSDTPIEAEFDNILQWTRNNKMIIKLSSIIIIVCTIFYLLVDRTLVAYAHEVTISPCQNALILCTGDLISPEVYIIIFKLRFFYIVLSYICMSFNIAFTYRAYFNVN
jgi:hypothetical protein